ncbi:hypothetical protein B0H15DRAFT_951751 [Mycena belliarum]|uniref:Uncharacterized protein n=1 Tax=Mycena belliarum TaxID=1033014 RepID=A0AAD6XM46_9AGAR|nr:hypothetical protein B0H15DRAFT_951751 [Mycena belliae]
MAPHGRKLLSPDEKAERRQASLARYREKKGDQLREAARLRMKRFVYLDARSTSPSQTSSRNRAALLDADEATVRRQKRRARKSSSTYRDGWGSMAFLNITLAPNLLSPLSVIAIRFALQMQSVGPGSAWCALLRSHPTARARLAPPARRTSVYANRARQLTNVGRVAEKWRARAVYMPHPSPPPSRFPSPAPTACVLLCRPTYYPDPGDEELKKLSDDEERFFYGITGGRFGGRVVTSRKTLDAIHHLDHRTQYFKASKWLRLIDLWNQNCKEYHNHHQLDNLVLRSPAVLPPAPDAAAGDETSCFLAGIEGRYPRSLFGRDDIAVLAAADPLAPDSIAALCSRMTLTAPRSRPIDVSSSEEHAPLSPVTISSDDECAPIQSTPKRRRKTRPRGTETSTEDSRPLRYIVTGHNQFFSSRAQALDILKETPGAHLFFARGADLFFMRDDNASTRFEASSETEG